MEGSLMRSRPRTEEDCPVAVRNGDCLDRFSRGLGNLSTGGLFARVKELPVGSHVTVQVGGAHPFEAEGIVRYALASSGIGIEFTSFQRSSTSLMYDHIADLTLRGLPAA
ncbi:MAG: PilZ domain-containing protein [Candidatus Acidiferrales bacterium]